MRSKHFTFKSIVFPVLVVVSMVLSTILSTGVSAVEITNNEIAEFISSTDNIVVAFPDSLQVQTGAERFSNLNYVGVASGTKVMAATTTATKAVTPSTPTYSAKSMKNFNTKNMYIEGKTFTDTSSRAQWAKDGIKTAYELGIINGIGNNQFNPTGNMSCAEAIKILAVIHSIYAYGDKAEAEVARYADNSAKHWVEQGGYLGYVKTMGLLDNTFDTKLNTSITRGELAFVWAKSIYRTTEAGDSYATTDLETTWSGWEYGQTANIVYSLPDVNSNTKYSQYIMGLYEAGIVCGSDNLGTYRPNSNITREEAATILGRLVDRKARIKGKTYANNAEYMVGDVKFNDSKDFEVYSREKYVTVEAQSRFIEDLVNKSGGVKLSADKKSFEANFELTPLPSGYAWVVYMEWGLGGYDGGVQRNVDDWINVRSGKYNVSKKFDKEVAYINVSIGIVSAENKNKLGAKVDFGTSYKVKENKTTWYYNADSGDFAETINGESWVKKIFNK